MKVLTAIAALAVTPAHAHELSHAHSHSLDMVPLLAGGLIVAAGLCGWLALRAMRGRR